MTKDEVFELSRAGADALQEELEKLKTVDRIQIRILEIENILKHAKIMDVNTVTVKYMDLNRVSTFQIVGTIEADPFAGKISNDSPLGKAVLRHKVGDVFHISTENGKELKVKLMDIK